jgi:hypothetical protein
MQINSFLSEPLLFNFGLFVISPIGYSFVLLVSLMVPISFGSVVYFLGVIIITSVLLYRIHEIFVILSDKDKKNNIEVEKYKHV